MDINKLITIKHASQYKVINGFQLLKWLYRFAGKGFRRSVFFAGMIYKGVLHPVLNAAHGFVAAVFAAEQVYLKEICKLQNEITPVVGIGNFPVHCTCFDGAGNSDQKNAAPGGYTCA